MLKRVDKAIDYLSLQEKLCAALPDCQAIYLFGSQNDGSAGDKSDIDLAFLAASLYDDVFVWELAQKLARQARRDVDLVQLLKASTVIRMQVIHGGRRIYCADLPSVERFEDYVFSAYARLNEERREILKDIKERGSVYGG